jgi:predicted nuclease with TOPRIM domain
MTREEAISSLNEPEHETKYDTECLIDEIYRGFEAELKAKDDRIAELEKELTTMHETAANLQKSRQTCLDRIEELEEIESKTCEWIQCEDPNGDTFYDTKCGQAHYFGNGNIADNHYQFCPFCGGEIDYTPKEE